jgi:hypothetical protein
MSSGRNLILEARKTLLGLEGLPFIFDKGCRYSNTCLQCPFSKCLQDLKVGQRRLVVKEYQLKRILELRDAGLNSIQIARAMKIKISYTRRILNHRQEIEDLLKDAAKQKPGKNISTT